MDRQTVLSRQVRFEAGGSSDGRNLVGLAVPFNEITRISNFFEGTFDEQFARGAFKRSIGLRTPKLQFEHGTHTLFGSLPIGEINDLTETDRGLEVDATMFEAELFAPLREAIASAAIDGMSIRFRERKVDVTEADARDDGGEVELRTITEAELIELGPVIFPAYEGTAVDLRSLDLASLDLDNENDRHHLALALLGGVSTGRTGSGQPPEPGTDPEAGSPAVTSDQDSRHSDPSAPHRNSRRARLARLHKLTETNQS